MRKAWKQRMKLMRREKTGKFKMVVGLLVVLVCVMWTLVSANYVEAANEQNPTAAKNIAVGLRSTSSLTTTKDGYMRVFYDGEKIGIEYYNDSFTLISKKSIAMELKYWGGFYAGADAYYIAEGQENKEESDIAEVIRIIKYSTSWDRLGAAQITGDTKLFGGDVRYPFDYGCVEMEEYNGTLYMVTGHEGYVDPAYNQGHQGFLMVAVDEATMTGKIVDCDLWHSFAQYIKKKDSNLYVLEQSEGSRCTKMTKYDVTSLQGNTIDVLSYGGNRTSAWAVKCYASVDDMEVSATNVFGLGTSIDQTNYENVTSDTSHNIYLTVTPLSNFTKEATTVKWLTNYTTGGKSFYGTKITKVNDNRFMISWEECESEQAQTDATDGLSGNILHYIFVDGNGNQIGTEYTAAASISDCHPIVKGTKIVYYASNPNTVDFYTIDANTGAFSKKVYRVAGDNATWNLEKGVLTISGSGDMKIDTESIHRYPVSSTATFFVSSSGDNAWKAIRNQVTKIVIGTGITSIPEKAFAGFSKLTEVVIKNGLSSIGQQAFYSCDSLKKVYIPSSVTSIGEDIVWTGSYWIGDESHVNKATICAIPGSYAEKYALTNNLKFEAADEKIFVDETVEKKDDIKNAPANSLLRAKITLKKKKYTYNGKTKKPVVTVVMDKKTLKINKDYKVSYKNNKKMGNATVTIKGIGKYCGKVTKAFTIVPKKVVMTKAVSPKAKCIKANWKKVSLVSGYQVCVATNSKFSKGKKIVTVKKSAKTATVSKLKKNKKFYVRVRAYKKIGKKTFYGAWSKVKTLTTKS